MRHFQRVLVGFVGVVLIIFLGAVLRIEWNWMIYSNDNLLSTLALLFLVGVSYVIGKKVIG